MKMKPGIFAAALLFGVLSANTRAPASQIKCEGKTLGVLGDSLAAGYGLNPGEGFPERLGVALRDEGYFVQIINAGVSGDTSTGGLARLDWSLSGKIDAVIVELGANDALRGIDPKIIAKNLGAIVVSLKSRGNAVLLVGMLAPPNMGKTYAEAFNAIYPELAKKEDVMLYPFFLDGVAGELNLNQADGIHPTAEGINVMVRKFLPFGIKLMQKVCER